VFIGILPRWRAFTLPMHPGGWSAFCTDFCTDFCANCWRQPVIRPANLAPSTPSADNVNGSFANTCCFRAGFAGNTASSGEARHVHDFDVGPERGQAPRTSSVPSILGMTTSVRSMWTGANQRARPTPAFPGRSTPRGPCSPGRAKAWATQLRTDSSSSANRIPFGAARQTDGGRLGFRLRCDIGNCGEVNGKGRAFAGGALDEDMPAALGNDAKDGGQAEAGPFADSLVVKKGSKRWDCVAWSMPMPVSRTASRT